MTSPVETVRDAVWLADRYDPQNDAVHFRRVDRAARAKATFLTDEYLGASEAPLVLRRADALAAAPAPAPLHFIFHSAFCCSTLLARAFDVPGVASTLKEPVLLNDLVGWRHRGGAPDQVGRALVDGLSLLARPFEPGEAVIVKPSNLVNGLALAALATRPQSNALLLHAPLRVYLGSVAKKGIDGRLWVRDLLVKLMREGSIDLGFEPEDYLKLTDLQAAAVGWLAQHQIFARLVERFGPARVRTLDSDRLMAAPRESVGAIAALFGLGLDDAAVEAIVSGPGFTRHSKTDDAFGADARATENSAAAEVHADEIGKVEIWAETIARGVGLSLDLAAPLLGRS